MRNLKRHIGSMVCLAALAGPAWADHEHALRLERQGAIVPLESIIDKARTLHQGHIIEVEFKDRHGTLAYEIEILDEHGNVWEMFFDARTGDLLSRSSEDTDHHGEGH